ncbi:hypothetical protein Q0590_05305 [Rhodocytophaga aerolata]|uniref:Uncharacterized protein n=1 Tax=Rhodocytophaga aerolata TaxID=455078 RepID=A0ABT8R159_9BACT|nr:hypothetical protein [Rhodocytophaga aerolata]MDO1445654.1 hypothetical protein [Rhodocytophaga aerolata]
MAIILALNPAPIEILKAVDGWVKLLEQEDYQSAYEYTEQNTYYKWSPKLIQAVIYGYGLPVLHANGEVYRITCSDTATEDGRRPQHEINYLEEPLPYEEKEAEIIGQIWYDLPLNGKWSDLTATFKIVRKNTHLTLELAEIHVF